MTDSSLDDGDIARLLMRTIDLLKQVGGTQWGEDASCCKSPIDFACRVEDDSAGASLHCAYDAAGGHLILVRSCLVFQVDTT